MVRVRGFDPRYIGSIPVSPAIRFICPYLHAENKLTVGKTTGGLQHCKAVKTRCCASSLSRFNSTMAVQLICNQ